VTEGAKIDILYGSYWENLSLLLQLLSTPYIELSPIPSLENAYVSLVY